MFKVAWVRIMGNSTTIIIYDYMYILLLYKLYIVYSIIHKTIKEWVLLWSCNYYDVIEINIFYDFNIWFNSLYIPTFDKNFMSK